MPEQDPFEGDHPEMVPLSPATYGEVEPLSSPPLTNSSQAPPVEPQSARPAEPLDRAADPLVDRVAEPPVDKPAELSVSESVTVVESPKSAEIREEHISENEVRRDEKALSPSSGWRAGGESGSSTPVPQPVPPRAVVEKPPEFTQSAKLELDSPRDSPRKSPEPLSHPAPPAVEPISAPASNPGHATADAPIRPISEARLSASPPVEPVSAPASSSAQIAAAVFSDPPVRQVSEATAPKKDQSSGPKESRSSAPSKGGASRNLDEKMGFGELKGDRPINITADRMDAFQKENRVVFEGNVVVHQDDTYIYARRITADVASQETGGGIRKVIAQQDVRISQNDRVATCDRAEFDHISRTIELSGRPKIWQGKDWIDGDKVLVQLDQEKMTVVGSDEKRVSAVLYPKGRTEPGEAGEGSEPPKGGTRPSLTAPFAPPAQVTLSGDGTRVRETARVEPDSASEVKYSPPAQEAPPRAPEALASNSSKRPSAEDRPTGSSMESMQRPKGSSPSPALESKTVVDSTPTKKNSITSPSALTSSVAAEDEAVRIASAAIKQQESRLANRPPEAPGQAGSRPANSAAAASPSENVEAFLKRWLRAWESKDLDAFMGCYSRKFRSGKWDWSGWRGHKAELNKKYQNIQVVAEGVQVVPREGGARVSFIQVYRADSYGDRGRKQLDLVQEDGRWKIISENWSQMPSQGL
jgi:lipopolysaccharide export system protein LptA